MSMSKNMRYSLTMRNVNIKRALAIMKGDKLFINYEECKYMLVYYKIYMLVCYSLTMRNVNM